MRLDDLGIDEDEYLTLADMLAQRGAAPAEAVPLEEPAAVEMASPTRRAPLQARPQAIADVREADELAAAQAADAEGGFRRGVTGAASNFINTLTRGAAPGARQAPAESRVRELLAQRAQQRDADMAGRRLGLEETRAGNEAARTRAYEAAVASQGTRAESSAEAQAKRLDLDEKRLGLAEQDVAIRRMLAERKAKGGGGTGKPKEVPLSQSTVMELADAPTAMQAIESLGETFKRLDLSGASGRVSGAATKLFNLQGTDAAKFYAAAKLAMQGVGKIMEGGKLAAGDEAKYEAMLPKPGDAPELAAQKVRDAQQYLASLVKNRVAALKTAGYRVPEGLGQVAPTAAPPSADAGAMVTVVDADGVEVDLPRAQAEALVKAGEARFK